MKTSAYIGMLILVTAIAIPTFVQAAQEQKTSIQKPQSFVEDTFTEDEHDLILSVKAVQAWTHQFLDVDDGEIDSETGAHMVEDLQDYFTEEMALKIYNQFHRPHLAEYEDVNDYVEVDSLVHRDVEHVNVIKNQGNHIVVTMRTSSVEDGAGNRAHFNETFNFAYDEERKTYVIAGMETEQVS